MYSVWSFMVKPARSWIVGSEGHSRQWMMSCLILPEQSSNSLIAIIKLVMMLFGYKPESLLMWDSMETLRKVLGSFLSLKGANSSRRRGGSPVSYVVPPVPDLPSWWLHCLLRSLRTMLRKAHSGRLKISTVPVGAFTSTSPIQRLDLQWLLQGQ